MAAKKKKSFLLSLSHLAVICYPRFAQLWSRWSFYVSVGDILKGGREPTVPSVRGTQMWDFRVQRRQESLDVHHLAGRKRTKVSAEFPENGLPY